MDQLPMPAPRMVFRSLGRDAWDRIGGGVMDKSGLTSDHREYNAQTWSLIYVLRGSGVYHDHTDGRRYPIAAGDCFMRLPDRLHSTTIDPASGWHETFLDVGPHLCHALISMQVIRSDPVVWHWGLTQERIARFTTLITDIANAPERRLPALLVRVLDLAVEILPHPASGDDDEDAIDRACRALAETAGSRLDLRHWCRREGLDYDRFRKDFQRRLGMPPHQYRLRRRMDHACALLQTTDRSIADIATELGYPTPYEFSAQFRQRMGIPPSRYRAR